MQPGCGLDEIDLGDVDRIVIHILSLLNIIISCSSQPWQWRIKNHLHQMMHLLWVFGWWFWWWQRCYWLIKIRPSETDVAALAINGWMDWMDGWMDWKSPGAYAADKYSTIGITIATIIIMVIVWCGCCTSSKFLVSIWPPARYWHCLLLVTAPTFAIIIIIIIGAVFCLLSFCLFWLSFYPFFVYFLSFCLFCVYFCFFVFFIHIFVCVFFFSFSNLVKWRISEFDELRFTFWTHSLLSFLGDFNKCW